jgi:peptidoglycan hydrolase-like protein with peptidoglycan-binding domain
MSQQQPAPDRYREIQQALADKGYFHGSVDGTWGADSMDSLKRFQTDQNLDADGKISALSLIALGLGPRHDAAAGRPAPLAPSSMPGSSSDSKGDSTSNRTGEPAAEHVAEPAPPGRVP